MSDKSKLAVYFTDETKTEIENLTEKGYARSQSEFVNKAVHFYIGYLRSNKNTDYLAPILTSIIKNQIKNLETNVSEMLFKLAVEVAKLNHVTASAINLDEDTLVLLNTRCCEDVAANNGRITFEDAYEYETYGSEEDD